MLGPLPKEEELAYLGINICKIHGYNTTERVPVLDSLVLVKFLNGEVKSYVDAGRHEFLAETYNLILGDEDLEIKTKLFFNLGLVCKKKHLLEGALKFLTLSQELSREVSQQVTKNLDSVKELLKQEKAS